MAGGVKFSFWRNGDFALRGIHPIEKAIKLKFDCHSMVSSCLVEIGMYLHGSTVPALLGRYIEKKNSRKYATHEKAPRSGVA